MVGVEPARNIAVLAEAAGIPTVPEFFDAASAAAVVAGHGRAAVILGRHVFAHVDDLHEFVEAVKACLTDDGVFLVEVPYVGPLLDHLEFDTVYHEHLSYFAIEPLIRLFGRVGLEIFDVARLTVHGGSLRVFVGRPGRHSVGPRHLRRCAALDQLQLGDSS
mgnify:CR=1 FL=1